MFSMLKLEDVYMKTVKEIRFLSSENHEVFHDLEESFGRNSPPIFPNCRLVELKATRIPKGIKIDFWQNENVSFHMNIVEKNMALAKRHQDSFAYNGPFLGIDNLHESSFVFFWLRIKQSHFSDKDEKKNCVNYPTEKFESFRECDEDYTNKEMQKLGIRPFWGIRASKNVSTSM